MDAKVREDAHFSKNSNKKSNRGEQVYLGEENEHSVCYNAKLPTVFSLTGQRQLLVRKTGKLN